MFLSKYAIKTDLETKLKIKAILGRNLILEWSKKNGELSPEAVNISKPLQFLNNSTKNQKRKKY